MGCLVLYHTPGSYCIVASCLLASCLLLLPSLYFIAFNGLFQYSVGSGGSTHSSIGSACTCKMKGHLLRLGRNRLRMQLQLSWVNLAIGQCLSRPTENDSVVTSLSRCERLKCRANLAGFACHSHSYVGSVGFGYVNFPSAQRSPPNPPAVGGNLSSHKTSKVYWPTPTVDGEAVTYAYVGISHGGVCALEIGRRTIVDVKLNIRIKETKIALFLENFKFFSFLLF